MANSKGLTELLLKIWPIAHCPKHHTEQSFWSFHCCLGRLGWLGWFHAQDLFGLDHSRHRGLQDIFCEMLTNFFGNDTRFKETSNSCQDPKRQGKRVEAGVSSLCTESWQHWIPRNPGEKAVTCRTAASVQNQTSGLLALASKHHQASS